MKSYILDCHFKIKSVWAEHGHGLKALKDRELFYSELGYADKALVLDENGNYKEIQLMPAAQTLIAAAIVDFMRPPKSVARRDKVAKAGAELRKMQTGNK